MYYQEKKTIASIISGLLVLGAYIIYGVSKYQEVGAGIMNDLKFWATAMLVFIGIGIVIAIVIQIVFHIILAVANEVKKEIAKEMAKEASKKTECIGTEKTCDEVEFEEFEDEMDKLIALKSMRNSFIVVGAGFVIALFSLFINMQPAIMLNIIFVSFMLGSLFEGFSQLYFYRKGVRNG